MCHYSNSNWANIKDSGAVYVSNPTIPTFSAIPDDICIGEILTLPSPTNGISGNWYPAINNQAITTYTFIPTNDSSGNCASHLDHTVVVNPLEAAPTFNFETVLCQGENQFTLPTTSTNGITGSWSPSAFVSTNFYGTQTFTFTANDGWCVAPITKDIEVVQNMQVPPVGPPTQTFNAGQTLADLQVTHTNTLEWYSNAGLTVWLPATTPLVNYATY